MLNRSSPRRGAGLKRGAMRSELGRSWRFSQPDELNRLSEAKTLCNTHTISLGIHRNYYAKGRSSFKVIISELCHSFPHIFKVGSRLFFCPIYLNLESPHMQNTLLLQNTATSISWAVLHARNLLQSGSALS